MHAGVRYEVAVAGLRSMDLPCIPGLPYRVMRGLGMVQRTPPGLPGLQITENPEVHPRYMVLLIDLVWCCMYQVCDMTRLFMNM